MKQKNCKNQLSALQSENKMLRLKLKQIENELFVLNEENNENSEKYLELLSHLEQIVDTKTKQLNEKIEEQIKIKEELEKSHRRYKLIVDHSREGIILTQNRKIKFVNPAFKKMTNQDYFKNMDFIQIFSEKVRSKIQSFFELDKYEIDKLHKVCIEATLNEDLDSIPVEVSAVHISDMYTESILFFIKNITFEKQRETEKRLIEVQRSGLAMAVTANHELKQPLMVISGNMELLESTFADNSPNEKQKHYLYRIKESINRINDILKKFRESNSFSYTDYTNETEMVKFEK